MIGIIVGGIIISLFLMFGLIGMYVLWLDISDDFGRDD